MPDDPAESFRGTHAAYGLRIHPRTAMPNWNGRGINVGWAIDVLHPRANSPNPH